MFVECLSKCIGGARCPQRAAAIPWLGMTVQFRFAKRRPRTAITRQNVNAARDGAQRLRDKPLHQGLPKCIGGARCPQRAFASALPAERKSPCVRGGENDLFPLPKGDGLVAQFGE